MKKYRTMITISILLFALMAVSIYANFYRHTSFSGDDVALTVNINRDVYQPVFISKHLGITSLVNAKFTLADSSVKKPDSVLLDKIELNTVRLSGLKDYKFLQSFFVRNSEGENFLLISMSLFNGTKSSDVMIFDDLYFDTNQTDIVISKVFYSETFQNKDKDSIMNLINSYGEKEKKSLITENGRICNFQCVHE